MGIVKTDGTLEGTQAVKGLHDASTSLIDIADVIEINHKLYFSFFQAEDNHLFIWETDGSASGSNLIYDEYAPAYFIPSNLSSDGSRLVFTGKGTDNTTSLLTLNTDTYEVTEIKQLVPSLEHPPYHRYSNTITRLSDNLFHIDLRHSYPWEVWFSDLTATNTVFSGIRSFIRSSFPPLFYKENFYFSGQSAHEGQELWKADPTFSKQELFMNINQSKLGFENPTSFSSFAALDDQVLFQAADAGFGTELWAYQQSTDGVSMVVDIVEGEGSSFPAKFTRFKGHIYFEARTVEGPPALFRSDGTAGGTLIISDAIEKSDYDPSISQMLPGKEQLYFVIRLKNENFGLCATDGTKSWLIKDFGLNESGYPNNVHNMVAAENKIFFSLGNALWVSDGTEGGTFKVKDFYGVSELTAANEKVYFVASEPSQGVIELWQSDGSSTGTSKITNSSAETFSQPDHLALLNNQLVFTATTITHGRELWKTDGTAAGTAMITNIRSGAASAMSSTEYALLDGFLYFSANDGINGLELWKTDGTAAGTAMVMDINSGAQGSQPKSFFSAGDLFYFSAYTPESGYELWSSQGTATNTRQVHDVLQGPQGSEPSDFMWLGKELYFTAETSHAGRQLWRTGDKEITAITPLSNNELLNVYPNPTADYLFIDSNGQPIKKLQLFRFNGQKIPLPGLPGSSLNVAHLPAGLYLLTIETDKKRYVKKFIKK